MNKRNKKSPFKNLKLPLAGIVFTVLKNSPLDQKRKSKEIESALEEIAFLDSNSKNANEILHDSELSSKLIEEQKTFLSSFGKIYLNSKKKLLLNEPEIDDSFVGTELEALSKDVENTLKSLK